MKLKSLLVLCAAAIATFSVTGCNLFRKNKKPKENPAIASEVEADFRQRWVDHRVAELVAKGTEATAARAEAEADFRAKYPYLKERKK